MKLKRYKKYLGKIKTYLDNIPENKLQFGSIYGKSVSLGKKLSIFILGYKENYTGEGDGLKNKKEWDSICNFVQKELFNMLGKDAVMYIEKYSKDEKFQASFETYVAFEEYIKFQKELKQ